jgi:hypothetical protein
MRSQALNKLHYLFDMKKNKSEILDYLGEIDLFICSSGFEERSTFLGKLLNSKKVAKAFVFHLEDNYILAERNAMLISENLNQLEKKVYPRHNAIETFDIFYSFFNEYLDKKNIPNVVIDITTFTREVLLILIKVLSIDIFINCFSVKLIYTPAESYPVWLTKGVRKIRSVFGYSGLHLPSKKLLLIILNGFETERTKEIIDSFESNGILLGKPTEIDSINDDLNRISKEKFNHIVDKYGDSILEKFEFSCQDIIKTKHTIETLVRKYRDEYNIVISPLNNKVSSLGVALLGIEDENVQVCYASANQYNIKDYSKGCDYFLTYNLNELLSK